MADIDFNNLDKLPQYKAAFDSLRGAVVYLSNSIYQAKNGFFSLVSESA